MLDFQYVIDFWFRETDPKNWWTKNEAFDAELRRRFLSVHKAAAACECSHWRISPRGRLAEIIVLDQFSRNMFRGSSESFAYDSLALALSQEAQRVGADLHLESQEKLFLIMPFMHSESKEIHRQAVPLFQNLGLKDNLDFELRHKAIIDRFGRYPHRNEILGRDSTPAELAFLAEPGSSF